jgi:hypothetical protein
MRSMTRSRPAGSWSGAGVGKLAHVTAYLTMRSILFAGDDYEEVATKVTGTLSDWGCWDA